MIKVMSPECDWVCEGEMLVSSAANIVEKLVTPERKLTYQCRPAKDMTLGVWENLKRKLTGIKLLSLKPCLVIIV